MIETVLNLSENIDTAVFYGVNNTNMRLIKDLHPSVKLMGRGHVLKLAGSDADVAALENTLQTLADFCSQHNTLTEQHIIDMVKGDKPVEIKHDHLIVHGVGGKSIVARTADQQKLVKDYDTNDLLFAIGPAGSGKTYTAIALALLS